MCNCGNNKGSIITDLSVVYTGCVVTCNGQTFKSGTSLRDVLDALLTNCSQGGESNPGSRWYSGNNIPTFPANPGDYYLQANGKVWTYEEVDGWVDTGIVLGGGGGTGGGAWGEITGDIDDQTDLITFINNSIATAIAGVPTVSAGIGLSDNQGKIDFGKLLVPTFRVVNFSDSDDYVYMGWADQDTGVSYSLPRLMMEKNSKLAGLMVSNPDLGDAQIQTSDVEGFTGMDGHSYIRYDYVGGNMQINATEQILFSSKSIAGTNIQTILLNATQGMSFTGGDITFGNSAGAMVVKGDMSRIISRVDIDFEALGKGVIVRSPNNSKYRLTVNDAGVLSAVLVS